MEVDCVVKAVGGYLLIEWNSFGPLGVRFVIHYIRSAISCPFYDGLEVLPARTRALMNSSLWEASTEPYTGAIETTGLSRTQSDVLGEKNAD